MLLTDARTMQELDRKTIEDLGIPGIVLMENAGRGCTEILLKEFMPELEGGCLVVAGPGNNGGDGFVIARHLLQKGFNVEVICLCNLEKFKGDALTNLNICRGLDITIHQCPDESSLGERDALFRSVGVIVDAIFGTGLSREVGGQFARAVSLINESPARVLAVDIASGLSSDTGSVLGCAVRADCTVTMALAKTGHVNWPGILYTGRLHVVDIGIPPALISDAGLQAEYFQEGEFRSCFRARPVDGHKGTFGHLLIMGGSRGKTGAICLAAEAALRSGAGLVTVAAPRSSQFIIAGKLTEAMTEGLPETPVGEPSYHAAEALKELYTRKKAACIGPGLGLSREATIFCQEVVARCPLPLVVDADGLNALAGALDLLKGASEPRILTPHPGEMARLLDCTVKDVQGDRMGAARRLAVETGATVVLKGYSTVTCEPSGRMAINSTGNSGMGTGGMGDCLTGIIGALLAQGYTPWDAARAGVYAHGRAADLLARTSGPYGYLAGEVADWLPRVWAAADTTRQPYTKNKGAFSPVRRVKKEAPGF